MWLMPKMFYIFNTNMTDAEVVRWDSDDAITHDHLNMGDNVMAPECVTDLDEVTLIWR
jgi:hypothetical protein